jgi:hypothetical protein
LSVVRFILYATAASVAWVVGLAALSRVSGWRQLADTFPAAANLRPGKWSFATVALTRVIPVWYRACARVGADAAGLSLSLLWPFSLSHPPIMIPWDRISIDRESNATARRAFLSISGTDVRLELSGNAAVLALSRGD